MRVARGCIALAFVVVLGACEGHRPPPIQASYDGAGKLRLLIYDSNGDGKPDTWSYMDGERIVRIEIDADGDGLVDRWEYYDARQKLEKVGTSSLNDGNVDTWTYVPPGDQKATTRVDISTARDGRVSRTEYYEAGVLVRAEEDTDGNGRIDKWETFKNGMVTSVAFDTEGTGQPTRRFDYDDKGRATMVLLKGDPAGHPVKH
jgi:hypothetical protein